MSYSNFTSLPPEEEQQFVVFERRTAEASKKAMTIGMISGGVLGLILIVLFLSSDPPKAMHADALESDIPAETDTKTPEPKPAATTDDDADDEDDSDDAEGDDAEGGEAEGGDAEGGEGEGGEGEAAEGATEAPPPPKGATKAPPTALVK